MIKAVLFDFNGVLVDDESQHCEALQRILADEGIVVTREQYYAHYLGLDDRTGFVEAFRRAHRTLTTEVLRSLVERKSQVYLQLVNASLHLVAGAAEFVRDAKQRYRLGIVSGAQNREIKQVLSRTGLQDQFEIIVGADDVPRCKPDPAPYLAALAAFNPPLAPSDCAAIEDSLPGITAARAAGMPCVVLATSHAAGTLEGRGAARVWDSLAGHHPTELEAL